MAPRFSDTSTFGTTRPGSIRISDPMPAQAGQAPVGELNENSLGSISGMVKPEIGHANLDERVMRRGALSPREVRELDDSRCRPPSRARFRANRRGRAADVQGAPIRSTTTSRSCLTSCRGVGTSRSG
jgi:hypothetical protein